MIEIIQKLYTFLLCFLQKIVILFESFLNNLDPSLFQNVIIGILMVLIFIGEQIFSEVKTQQKRGEFSRMVIFYEILNITRIAVLSVFSIFLISFFKDSINSQQIHSIELEYKILITLFVVIVGFILIKPIFKFQVFFRGKRHKFEINFMKRLSFSKILTFKNKVKSEKMIRAWNSFWSEKSEFNERDFTKIFISHIDDAIKLKKFELSIQLAQTYKNNINNRDNFSIGNDFLPKVFEWNEIFWNEQQLWIKNYDVRKEKKDSFFRKVSLKFFKETKKEDNYFWNWHYFGGDFFQIIIKILLKNGHGPYQLFSVFKEYIEESEKKLDKITNTEDKEKYWNYITGLFVSFCPTFFNEINKAPLKYDIWENYFPEEWKISMSNIDKRVPRIVLHEFLQWSADRLFKKDSKDNLDKDLTEVINGIYSNIHSSLFKSFLVLFHSSEIKYAIEKEPNFYISGPSVSLSGSIEENDEDRDRRLTEMMGEKINSQEKETVQIILNFFHFWPTLTLYKDNLSSDELKDWDIYTEEKKQLIVKRVRKEKLEKIKIEIESKEIKELCNKSEEKELHRKRLLELVVLLIKELDK